MHKRIAVVVSAVLFALLAVTVAIVADLHDRAYPVQLGAKSMANLDFANSGIADEEAFRQLGMLSDRLGIGLVKVAPDLSGDQSGEVFVAVGAEGGLPSTIRRFGNEADAQIKGSAALEHSYASGQYLVTGATDHLDEFKARLTEDRIAQEWSDDTLATTVSLVVRQGSLVTSLIAAVALMVSLVLYWLSVKAKSRALRVLAGVPTWRIQYEDLAGFLLAMLAAAVMCDLAAVVYLGLAHSWAFVPYYIWTLLTFDAFVILTTMVCALVMSVVSRPSVAMLAAREPAVKSLRKTSVVLKAATFALVLVAVAPTLRVYTDSKDSAVQQAQWKSLADHVAVSFPAAMGEQGFQRIKGDVGDVVNDAELRDSVALSYTWNDTLIDRTALESYDGLSLVNQEWLDLMLERGAGGDARGDESDAGLIPLAQSQVPDGIRRFLGPNLELWSRDDVATDEVLTAVSFYRYSGSVGLPVSLGGNGGLVFLNDAIVVVAPSLHPTFNDDFLASAASTNNLVFAGLGPTQALLAQHGLEHELQVKYVAEEGVLRAQLTAYFAWLQGASLVALIVALIVSTLVGAFITAVLKVRRDFPLRLAGKRWSEILADRVAREWAVGAMLAVLVILVQRLQGVCLVAAVGVVGLLASALMHGIAARWTFANVSLRKL